MPRDGSATKQRILDTAHDLILQQGYAATSLDQILGASGATKGAFFHHFASKEAMAEALFEQYVAGDERIFVETFERAEGLTSDPLQQVLLTIGFFEETYRKLEAPHPGCLLASYVYQSELMTPERRRATADAFLLWRNALSAKLREAEALHPPVVPIDHDALGDMLSVIQEGGLILAKVMDDPGLMARYLRVFRTHIEMAFGIHVPTEVAATAEASPGHALDSASV
jgi:TetR/AcrR family transcriptional repressor of nem operon